MTKDRLLTIKQANGKYNVPNPFTRGANRGQTGVNKVVMELVDEIETLHENLDSHESVIADYAKTVLSLRRQLEIANSVITAEDLPLLGEDNEE